jgi:protein TonB
MPFSEHRRLIQALVLSVAGHAVLLLDVVRIYPPDFGAPATAITVVIEQKRPPDPIKSVMTAPDAPRKAKELAPAPNPPKRTPRRASPEQPRIATREASLVSAPTVPGSTELAALDASLPASVPAPAPANVPSAGEAPGAREGVSADDLRQYRVSLASAARRFKRYPALAREQGWEGTVEVAIRFRSALPAPEVALVRSSGRDLLDEQAVAMLAQAARTTALPEGLRGLDFEIPLPVKFSLDEAQ